MPMPLDICQLGLVRAHSAIPPPRPLATAILSVTAANVKLPFCSRLPSESASSGLRTPGGSDDAEATRACNLAASALVGLDSGIKGEPLWAKPQLELADAKVDSGLHTSCR